MFIDAHILCTPSIGDIDGDGADELVVAASYFFDREYYDDPVRALNPKSAFLNPGRRCPAPVRPARTLRPALPQPTFDRDCCADPAAPRLNPVP